jgi:DNA-binding YbaB/EbfC family protein
MKARLPKGYSQGPNNFEQMAKQVQQLQEEMQEATEKLEDKEYSATSGNDTVEAVVSGKLELIELKVKDELLNNEDHDMILDFITIAVNEAIKKAKDEKEETLSNISGGIEIPGMF